MSEFYIFQAELWVKSHRKQPNPTQIIISLEWSPLIFFWLGLSPIIHILRSYTSTVWSFINIRLWGVALMRNMEELMDSCPYEKYGGTDGQLPLWEIWRNGWTEWFICDPIKFWLWGYNNHELNFSSLNNSVFYNKVMYYTTRKRYWVSTNTTYM